MSAIFGIQKHSVSPSLELPRLQMFTVSVSALGFPKEPKCVCICPSPCLVLQITELIRWSEQWIPSTLGYHRRSLSQQGLIHQSCSSDAHITLCYIQMELSRNSNVFTSLCQLWAAFSGTRCMQPWVTAEHLLSLWEVFDFCSPFSCCKVKKRWYYKRWFLMPKDERMADLKQDHHNRCAVWC